MYNLDQSIKFLQDSVDYELNRKWLPIYKKYNFKNMMVNSKIYLENYEEFKEKFKERNIYTNIDL